MNLNQWTKYREREEYFTAAPFTYIKGSRKSAKKQVCNFLKLMVVTQESINANLKAPNEVYKRALRRLRDGHIDVNTFSVSEARRHDTREQIWILHVEVAASLRNKMHSVRIAMTSAGVVLSAPYTLCSCEVGALDCAHVISIHLASMHVDTCVRLWTRCRGDDEPLTDSEILSLFPPCVVQAQRIPCRAQHLALRASRSKFREKATQRLIFELVSETGETDDDTDDESVEETGKDIPLDLENEVLVWSAKILKLEDNNTLPDRPRAVSNAYLATKEMQEDVEKYLQEFPLNRKKQFEQDYIHELEYSAMYRGEIPRCNNWGFYLYKTARERQQRIQEYNRDSGGATLQVSMYQHTHTVLISKCISYHTHSGGSQSRQVSCVFK